MIDLEHAREEAMSELAFHADLLGKEISFEDLKLLGVFGAIKRGFTKADSLEIYGVSEEHYDKNIGKALGH